jgi:hypothetical protein
MKVTGAEERGWDLDSVHPYYWWMYSLLGTRYIRVEILCWTSPPGECMPKISPDGTTFYFGQKVPELSFDMFRQFIYYNSQLIGDPNTSDAALFQQGVTCRNRIEEHFNLKPVTLLIKLKLPFVCNQDFDDPYHLGLAGYQYTSFPHECENNTPFYVFSVSMCELAAPRCKAAPVKVAHQWNIQQPAPPAPPGPPQPPGNLRFTMGDRVGKGASLISYLFGMPS